jgi:hypothetical protein
MNERAYEDMLAEEPFNPPAWWKRLLAVPVWHVLYAACRLVPIGWWLRQFEPGAPPGVAHDWRARLWLWLHATAYWWFERIEGRI